MSQDLNQDLKNKGQAILPPKISDYLDYRSYLSDYYQYRKEISKNDLRPYNYQMFSAAANIKSPNYLKMIIEGQRNLSSDMVLKFAKALGLNKEQTIEFDHLVNLNQASDTSERNIHLKKLSENRVEQKLKSGEIDRKTWEKVPNWVAWVIYAMIDQEGVVFTTKTLKELLRNKASDSEIDNALNSLFASGEIKKDPLTGEIRKAHHLMDSADEIPVQLVRKLQMQLMYLGLESLYQDAPQEREFGTLTLSLTKEEFEEIKFKLRQFRKSVHKDNSIARGQNKGQRVYQLNIQLFPVTDKVSEESLAAQKLAKEQKEQAAKMSAGATGGASGGLAGMGASSMGINGTPVQFLAEQAMQAASLFESSALVGMTSAGDAKVASPLASVADSGFESYSGLAMGNGEASGSL